MGHFTTNKIQCCLRGLILLLTTAVATACNNYGLDDKIAKSLGTSNAGTSSILTITAPAAQSILVQNKSTQLASLKFTASGGSQPYSFTGALVGVPANITMAIDATGLVTLTRNTAIAYPPNVSNNSTNGGLTPAGNLKVIVTDASGTSQETTYAINVRFKRAFITAATGGANFSAGAGILAGCTGPAASIDKANCACQNVASAAGFPTASKFRVWLSYIGVNAICNITNNANLGCVAVAANDGGPWYTTPGLKIADDISSSNGVGLLGSTTPLQNMINMNELGSAATSEAYTGTQGSGIVDAGGGHCNSWGAGGTAPILGTRLSLTPAWSMGASGMCATAQALYCFESD